MRYFVLLLFVSQMLTLCFAVEKKEHADGSNRQSVKGVESSKADEPKPYEVKKNSIGMEFVWIPAGEFMMGSGVSESKLRSKYEDITVSDGQGSMGWALVEREYPQHLVKLTKGFWMGRHEVTQAQYKTIMGTNPSHFRYQCSHCNKFVDPSILKEEAFSKSSGSYPVESLTQYQAIDFCRALSKKEDKTYSLPTEAQWEYACRAGTTTNFSFGDDYAKLGEHAWFELNSDQETHPVGQKKPNAWGLYDMLGNVSEWCLDYYDPNSYTKGPVTDPVNRKSAFLKHDWRVERGGCFLDDIMCRSASRGYNINTPVYCEATTGFRVICEEL